MTTTGCLSLAMLQGLRRRKLDSKLVAFDEGTVENPVRCVSCRAESRHSYSTYSAKLVAHDLSWVWKTNRAKGGALKDALPIKTNVVTIGVSHRAETRCGDSL